MVRSQGAGLGKNMGADSDLVHRGQGTWSFMLAQAEVAAALGRELRVPHTSPVRMAHSPTGLSFKIQLHPLNVSLSYDKYTLRISFV